MIEILLVGIGGSAGALARFGVGRLVSSRSFPWATVGVNVVGSAILGVVLFAPTDSAAALLVGVGFCGAFTTFSSFSYHTVTLWDETSSRVATVHAVGTLLAALIAFGIGAVLGTHAPL